MTPVPDHIKPDLDVLFVGFNPSIRSSETGHHYAGPNNRFWTIMHEAGLTPKKLSPKEDADLLSYGYGSTNIVPRPTKEAAEITRTEYAEGAAELRRKIIRYSPKVVCFVGKGVYQQYSRRQKVEWGRQEDPVLPDVTEFVAPSSSGLVRMKKDEIVGIYKELSRFVHPGNREPAELAEQTKSNG
ncbi:G/U mismatch-specific DNA glycosylase [Indiicoccus explosivorum]|uniref:G/U mismatch-specific DNA glycosylase n=1 Tax=Indiicoccus explosivorum TaxID=1917864 RepID=UPI000B45480C|nr:G/U mismatch-specific DNA glycosylase [Indiicoccus explosivorum]